MMEVEGAVLSMFHSVRTLSVTHSTKVPAAPSLLTVGCNAQLLPPGNTKAILNFW